MCMFRSWCSASLNPATNLVTRAHTNPFLLPMITCKAENNSVQTESLLNYTVVPMVRTLLSLLWYMTRADHFLPKCSCIVCTCTWGQELQLHEHEANNYYVNIPPRPGPSIGGDIVGTSIILLLDVVLVDSIRPMINTILRPAVHCPPKFMFILPTRTLSPSE